MKTLHIIFLFTLSLGLFSCVKDEVAGITADQVSEQEVDTRTTGGPFIMAINCVPAAYLVTLNDFVGQDKRVKYAVYSLESLEIVDQGQRIVSGTRFLTNPVLDNCTPYRIVVEARDLPNGPIIFYEEVISVWCQGDPVC